MQSVLTGLDEITQKFKDILEKKKSEIKENIEQGDFINIEKELKELTDNFAKDIILLILDREIIGLHPTIKGYFIPNQ